MYKNEVTRVVSRGMYRPRQEKEFRRAGKNNGAIALSRIETRKRKTRWKNTIKFTRIAFPCDREEETRSRAELYSTHFAADTRFFQRTDFKEPRLIPRAEERPRPSVCARLQKWPSPVERNLIGDSRARARPRARRTTSQFLRPLAVKQSRESLIVCRPVCARTHERSNLRSGQFLQTFVVVRFIGSIERNQFRHFSERAGTAKPALPRPLSRPRLVYVYTRTIFAREIKLMRIKK